MGEVYRVIDVLSEERTKVPVQSPTCEAAELSCLGMYSSYVRNNKILKTSDVLVFNTAAEPQFIEAIVIKKHRPFGPSTALVTQCSSHLFEGMLIEPTRKGYFYPCRPFFAYARYSIHTDEVRELQKNLEFLNLQFPDSSDAAMNSLIGLLTLCNISIGNHFKNNIYQFSDWMMSERRNHVHSNWGF